MSDSEWPRILARVTRSWQRLALMLAVGGTVGAGVCLGVCLGLLQSGAIGFELWPGAVVLFPLIALSALALGLGIVTAVVSLMRREGRLAWVGLAIAVVGLVIMAPVVFITAFMFLPFSID